MTAPPAAAMGRDASRSTWPPKVASSSPQISVSSHVSSPSAANCVGACVCEVVCVEMYVYVHRCVYGYNCAGGRFGVFLGILMFHFLFMLCKALCVTTLYEKCHINEIKLKLK